MKVLFVLAPVAILIAGILPSMAYLLDIIQYPESDLRVRALFATLIMIGVIVVSLVATRTLVRWLSQPLYYLLGTLTIGSSITIVYWILKTILITLPVTNNSILFLQRMIGLVWIGTVIYSIINFHRPHMITTFQFTSPHISRPRKFVYLADIQFGSTSKQFLEGVIQTVNDLQPEAILFGGDLVDADYYARSDFEVLSTLQVPLYFITGNHEYYHDATKIISYIKDYPHVHIMDNERTDLGAGVELITIDYRDASIQSQYELHLDDLVADPEKFSIFMFHEPKRVESTAQRGYDLQLYGHVHAGQIFPGNFLARLVYGAYAYGQSIINHPKTKYSTTVYTTLGAGLWGPRMRRGSRNEIVVVHIIPKI